MGQLSGKTVIITGASSGIGVATARALAGEGANLVLGARRADRLTALAAELPGEAAWQVTDVTSREQVRALAALALERFGRIDVLINNAGIMPISKLGEGRVDDWDRMIDVNLKGVLYGIDAVLGHMLERGGGHIVNISSVAAFKTSPMSGVYAATKAGVRIISESLRQEVAGRVAVTVVYPGAVSTALAQSIPDDAFRETMAKALGDGALDPGDIASVILNALTQPANVRISDIIVRPANAP